MQNKRVFLVSCVGKKRQSPSAAQELYISPWFMKARRHVEARQTPWFILSAEYGLVKPDTVLEPYNKSLNTMKAQARRQWASRVLHDLLEVLPRRATVVFLAGWKYREHLIEGLQAAGHPVEVPMEGLGIGQQLGWFDQANQRGPLCV